MRRWVLALLICVWLLGAGAGAEEERAAPPEEQAVSEEVDVQEAESALAEVDLSAWQTALDGAGVDMKADEVLRELMRGETGRTGEALLSMVRQTVREEIGSAAALVLGLLAPAVLSGVVRQVMGEGRTAGAAELVCYLTGAGLMLGSFARELQTAQDTAARLGTLTQQVFPVLTALMSASGRTGTAGMLQTAVSLSGGVLTAFVQRVMKVLGGSAAVLAAAGNLTERMPLKGLFKLCCSAGNWLLGGVMVLFIGMTTLGGVLGSAQDGMTLRAAKYAAGSLLPVVGGDVAGTMDSMVYSAGLVRQAAGVTGVAVMLAVCLRPVIRLMLTMGAYMLSGALAEPLGGGALRNCMEQMSDGLRLLLAGALVSAVLFISLTGVYLSGGGV